MQRIVRIIAATGLAAIAMGAGAEPARMQPDFTFKRIGVPEAGSVGNLITVQIAPRPNPAVPTPYTPAENHADPASTVVTGTEWFWMAVSPRLADSGPGRLTQALAELQQAPAGEAPDPPRLQTLQQIASTYGREILSATVGTNVSPALVLAMIAVESGGRADAVSHAGAQGLMQLMPATAARFGVSDSLVANDNIAGGVAYLDWLMNRFARDPILVLAGYNAGEGAVRDNAGVPPYAETRAYVPKVLAAWNVARSLCMTPPELMTDGCVFNLAGG